jgi:hypothetical protein
MKARSKDTTISFTFQSSRLNHRFQSVRPRQEPMMPTLVPQPEPLSRPDTQPGCPFVTVPCDVLDEEPATLESPTFAALIDLLLKDQRRLDRIARDPQRQRELIPRFLAIGMIGYTIFAIGLAIVFNASGVWPRLHSISSWLAGSVESLMSFPAASAVGTWLDGSALALMAAFVLGLIGALGVCLPSFYFYGLLAGVPTNMLQVTTHAVKGMASAAVAVIGVLPIYIAIVLGTLVFGLPDAAVRAQCVLGMMLPFVAGLWGTRSLYIGFVALSDMLPPDRRCRRGCFLRRLMFSWCACLTAVTPVMVFTLWEYLGR